MSQMTMCTCLNLLVLAHGARAQGTPVAALLDKYGREPERSAASAADATAAYAFAVVGGYHFSGTSLVDRLISTQPWALGAVRPPETRSYGVVLPNCARPGCRAPEAEVNFWTSEVYAGAGCGTGQNWGWTGTCARRWSPARESSLHLASLVDFHPGGRGTRASARRR